MTGRHRIHLAIGLNAGLLLMLVAGTAHGQIGEYNEAHDVRQATEEILTAPEFRNFARLKRSDGLPMGAQDDGDSNDRRNRSRRERIERNNERNSSGSFFGGGVSQLLSSAVGGVMTLLAWAALAAVAVLIVWLVVRALTNYERKRTITDLGQDTADAIDEEPEQAPGETAADVFIARAKALATEGRYRDAIGQLLLGAMSRIEQAGLIRYRRGLTYRDYLRAVRSRDNAFAGLRAMVRTYEPIGFGRREATRAHFEQTLNGYETGFRGTLSTPEN